MKVSEFLAAVYRCRTCRHHIEFDETCAEHVRGDEFVCGCPAESTPCDKWEPSESGLYSDVSPVEASYSRRLVAEAEAFDRERRDEAWLIETCYTDGRIAQAIDRQNAEAKEDAR